MNKVIILILVLVSSLAFGQTVKDTKKQKAIDAIIGTWIFKSGIIKDKVLGDTKIETWSTDTLHFYSNMTVKINTHDRMQGKVIKRKGLWDISDNTDTLVLKELQAIPPYNEPVTNTQLPIKLKTNRLIIFYSVSLKLDERDSTSISTEPGTAEISYGRLK